MYSAYKKQWNDSFPSFANHNHTKSIGYSKLTGIFLKPNCAYTTNRMYIGENEYEYAEINKMNYRNLYKINVLDRIDEYNELINSVENYLVGETKKCWTNGVYIYNKDIVRRMFPDLCQKTKEGLIDITELSPILPGIYKIGDYVIFAHKYFRRGFSYKNTLNSPFLERIETLNLKSASIKIAIDFDCVGLAKSMHKEFEYAYWWGPKFSDDLNNISLGVTRHENEKFDALLSEYRFTEFGWYIQDDKHTFECEEITDIPNIFNNNDELCACRFVHSMVNKNSGLPIHLDGAIRSYTIEKMIERLDISIKDSDRDTQYTKIWRIDGNIPIEKWKELITHYYRDNMMIGEYFGGEDENIALKEENEKNNNEEIKQYLPCKLSQDDGICLCFSFENDKDFSDMSDIRIIPVVYFFENEKKYHFVEDETVTLCKLINRNGIKTEIMSSKIVSFGDMVYNFPVFECKSIDAANILILSIWQLCKCWKKNDDNRIISYTIKS